MVNRSLSRMQKLLPEGSQAMMWWRFLLASTACSFFTNVGLRFKGDWPTDTFFLDSTTPQSSSCRAVVAVASGRACRGDTAFVAASAFGDALSSVRTAAACRPVPAMLPCLSLALASAAMARA